MHTILQSYVLSFKTTDLMKFGCWVELEFKTISCIKGGEGGDIKGGEVGDINTKRDTYIQ